MVGSEKTVALVDWCWQGHHPTYFNNFVLALEALDVEVLALCPNPEEAESTARSTRPGSSSVQNNTAFIKIKESARRFEQLRPARLSGIDWTLRHFRTIEKQVGEWISPSGRKVEAIFYACMYDWDFQWINVAHPFLRYPWMGLYLHAMSYRMPGKVHPYTGRVPCPEKIFSTKKCKSIAILDEGIKPQVEAALSKPVVVMPDLTDERLATHDSGKTLAARLQHFAAGRPIIGLFGHLQLSKGVLTFLEAARNSIGSDLCFALGGDIIWPADSVEVERIQMSLVECPHVWTHLARIPDGDQMNALLQCCSVLFAGYWDFPHSSNIMTKAALLEKPLIVSEDYLMAERVRRFHLGEVVPQRNAEASLEAILKITNSPSEWVSQNKPHWEDYLRVHSFERLKDSFEALLASIEA